MNSFAPTPIFKCRSNLKNTNIFVKRDDLLTFSFGGNKVRIALEFFEDMKIKGYDCIIGYGNARSNLCRAVANLGARFGIVCHIVSPVDDNAKHVSTCNSKIVDLCGAHIHYCTKCEVADTVEKTMLDCKNAGLNPYYINGDKYGRGNEAIPVRAYAKVYKEIMYQAKQMGIRFDYIFLPTGTGMTQSGLLAGKTNNNGNEKIVGISVARKKTIEIPVIERYLFAYFGQKIETEINIRDEFLSGGYGKFNRSIVDTIRYSMLMNGLPLDPTYTGKAFWGMLETIKQTHGNSNVLFIHTGGTPLFFDDIELLVNDIYEKKEDYNN